MRIKNYFIYALLVLTAVTSCKKDDDATPTVTPTDSNNRVLVTCEGSFGGSNSSLSIYTIDSAVVSLNAFESINGYAPGDVMQSISSRGEKIYLVMNGSSKIEVLDIETLEAESPITGLQSPRTMLAVGSAKAYVSNIYTNEISILDLAAKTIVGNIDVGGWSEGMLAIGTEVFVTRNNGSAIMVVDSTTDQVVDSILTGLGPKDIVRDVNGDLWLLSYGFDASFNTIDAMVSRIDPSNRTVIESFAIPTPWSYDMDLRINGDGDRLYVLNNNVYSMGIGESGIGVEALIDNGANNYGLGIDPESGDIYVGKAPNFSSEGIVLRYDSEGTLIDEFEVGIAPNGFYFGN